jgi:hypothetical protein
MMNYLYWVGFWVVVALAVNYWPRRRPKTEREKAFPKPKTLPFTRDPNALYQHSRFEHRGMYHNRYRTTGRLNRISPWITRR